MVSTCFDMVMHFLRTYLERYLDLFFCCLFIINYIFLDIKIGFVLLQALIVFWLSPHGLLRLHLFFYCIQETHPVLSMSLVRWTHQHQSLVKEMSHFFQDGFFQDGMIGAFSQINFHLP